MTEKGKSCCPSIRPNLNPGNSSPLIIASIAVDRSSAWLRSTDGNGAPSMAGTGLKLPPETIASLLSEKGVKRLKYFPNGHVKKDYAVLPRRILQDQSRMKKLLRESMRFVQDS